MRKIAVAIKHLRQIGAIMACVAIVAACSSEKENVEPEPDNTYDRYGVANWDNPDDFIVKRYYTLVDTLVVRQPDVSVVIRVTPGVETSVEWVIDGNRYQSTNVDEPSNSGGELIIKTYYPPPYDYKDGSTVDAYVTVGENSIERNAVIEEEAFERDVLSVDFGMDSISVKAELEQAVGVTRFFMRDETTGVDLLTPHFPSPRNGRTLYIFEDNELTEVGEFPDSVWDTDEQVAGATAGLSPFFLDFCRKVGFEGEIEILDGRYLASEYEWEREGIVYRIHSRDDVFPVEPSGGEEGGTRMKVDPNGSEDGEEDSDEPGYRSNSIGISYRKL